MRVCLRSSRSIRRPGVAIISAYIQVRSEHSHSEHTDLFIRGENEDNPGAFAASSGNISSRTKTVASVTWNNLPAWTGGDFYDTLDLSSIIQEIVDRPGWASGNAMAICKCRARQGGQCYGSGSE